MIEEYPSSELAVIRYHSSTSDPFYKPDAASRKSYYGASGYPTCYFDGVIQVVGGGSGTYWSYRNAIGTRRGVPTSLDIDLSGSYNPSTRTGTIDVRVVAIGPIFQGNLRLRYTLVESGLPYGGDVYDQVLRDVFPSPTGIPITISFGDTLYDSQNFSLESGWNYQNCDIVVFVQSDNNREVLQAGGWEITVGIEEQPDPQVPEPSTDLRCIPNPFGTQVEVRYGVPDDAQVDLRVYDGAGELVRRLAGGFQSSGHYTVRWDGRADAGERLPGGVYFCKLMAGEAVATQKLILLR